MEVWCNQIKVYITSKNDPLANDCRGALDGKNNDQPWKRVADLVWRKDGGLMQPNESIHNFKKLEMEAKKIHTTTPKNECEKIERGKFKS